MGFCEREKQSASSFGQAPAAKCGIDVVAKVTGKGFNIESVFGPKADCANDYIPDPHLKVVSRHRLLLNVAIDGSHRPQHQFSVGERTNLEEVKLSIVRHEFSE